MNVLLPELFNEVCDDIFKITDMRNLSRVCTYYNKICAKYIFELEKLYRKKYDKLLFAKQLDVISVEKYTIEIILDNYCHLLPERYYTNNNTMICNMFAFVGNLELLKIASSKSCPITNSIYSAAAYNGHVDVLNWVRSHTRIAPDDSILSLNAGIGGHTKVLEWMQKEYIHIYVSAVTYNAATNGHLHVFQWFKNNNNVEVLNDFTEGAAEFGQLHIIKWAHDNNCIKDNNFCLIAADTGHINILQWAYDVKMSMDIYDYEVIIQNGHVDVLQWFLDHNFDIAKHVARMAIKHGQIDVLMWAIKNGFEPNNEDISVCDDDILCHESIILQLAVLYDQVIVLQWLMKTGYVINNTFCKYVIIKKKINIIQFLIENDLIDISRIEYTELYNPKIELIITYDKENFDDISCVNLLLLNTDIAQMIIEKYGKFKKQYHFILSFGRISISRYGYENICDKQKLIRSDYDGEIVVCDFNCEHNCWWYFLIYCKNCNDVFKKWTKTKIDECDVHRKYVCFFN